MMWPVPYFYAHVRAAVLSHEECAEVIAMHERYPAVSGYLPDARECALFWINYDPSTEWLFDRITSVAVDENRRWDFILADKQATGLQLTRYRPGERYDWHMDLGGGAMSLRKLSIAVELSEPTEHGGGFEVFYREGPGNDLRLNRGDAAIFPSWVIHRARTPVHVERWSLAAWICGQEPFR